MSKYILSRMIIYFVFSMLFQFSPNLFVKVLQSYNDKVAMPITKKLHGIKYFDVRNSN